MTNQLFLFEHELVRIDESKSPLYANTPFGAVYGNKCFRVRKLVSIVPVEPNDCLWKRKFVSLEDLVSVSFDTVADQGFGDIVFPHLSNVTEDQRVLYGNVLARMESGGTNR